ncbi:hypothetical protein HK102_005254 [Quaeritorhiza haematococci]|nr:hypothetical protein HK102_005254 [Quaeritorhiza haematococci]
MGDEQPHTSANGNGHHVPNTNDDNEYVWYLAYGSNMNPNTLSNRRKVFPKVSKGCTVPGWYLNFDVLALPYFEPSFASISTALPLNPPPSYLAQFPGPPQHLELQGVVHKITKTDFENICRTEGGGGHKDVGYQRVTVDVVTYEGEQLKAVTLSQGSPRLLGLLPYSVPCSERYAKILVEGARHHHLNPAWISYLESLPFLVSFGGRGNSKGKKDKKVVRTWSEFGVYCLNQLGRWTFLAPFMVLGSPLFVVIASSVLLKKKSPRAVHIAVEWMTVLIWKWYHVGWSRLFPGLEKYSTYALSRDLYGENGLAGKVEVEEEVEEEDKKKKN